MGRPENRRSPGVAASRRIVECRGVPPVVAALGALPLAAGTLTMGRLSSVSAHAEMWSLLGLAVRTFGGHSGEFLGTLAGALVLGALCWWAANEYSRLWNLRFRVTLYHHALCLLAAALTVIFVVVFVSLRYAREAAEASIDLWRVELLGDAPWANRTFAIAYDRVKALGIEDFSEAPPPSAGGLIIPESKPETITTAASVYADAAAVDFRQRRPFLSRVLSVRAEVPRETISRAVQAFFKGGGTEYKTRGAIDIATAEIKSTLQPQTGRVVALARGILAALFLLVQLVPFGWIGLAAYRDLKVTP